MEIAAKESDSLVF